MEAWHLLYVMQCVNYVIKVKQLYVQFINHQVKYFSYLIRKFDKCIICSYIFICRLYLLAEGRVAYFGSRKKAQEFFSR
jgi:hypothetical protein